MQGAELRKHLEQRLLYRHLERWREAAELSKEREARIREQLGRCRIEMVARGGGHAAMAAAGGSSGSRGSLGSSSGSQQMAGAKRRRAGDVAAAAAAAAAAATLVPEPVATHLPLAEIVVPELTGALLRGGYDPANNPAAGLGASLASRSVGGQSPLLWKVVLCTGVEDVQPGAPVSTLHASAAAWLRSKLSCGRMGTPYAPPAGEDKG